MKAFLFAVDRINRWVGAGMSYVILAMILMTVYEVISRFVFQSPTIWAHKITAQTFGFYMIMAGGYAVLLKAHIRVDVLWSRLSPRKRAIVDLCTFTLAFLFITMLLYRVGIFAWQSTLIMERSYPPFSLPVWPLKLVMILGVSLLFLQLIAKYIRDLRLAITGVEYD
jgi:TRAP-type mannitol/chloroaromatic compound transport system permease small subunit